MSQRPQIQGHLLSLDGVRGLAILMVVVSHAFFSNSANSGPVYRWVGDFLLYGLFGVDLFFVLSGFLITGILVDSVDGSEFFKKFYVRRMLRIFPLYYGVLLVLLLLTPLLHLHWGAMWWLFAGYLQNLRPTEIATYSPGADLHLNHFWSLAIEEQFYLMWPAAVFFIRSREKLLLTTIWGSLAALALRLALVSGGVGPHAIHVLTITRADSLLLGGTLALLFRSDSWRMVQRCAGPGLAVSGTILLASIAMLPREFDDHVSYTLGQRLWINGARYTVLAFGSACLITLSLRTGSIWARVFERQWLRFFGKYSYGIYVLHMVALSFLLSTQRAAILRWTHSKAFAVAGAGVSSLALSVGAAVVCFHVYEKPFLRLKRYFDYAARRESVDVREPSPSTGRTGHNLVESESYTSEVSLR